MEWITSRSRSHRQPRAWAVGVIVAAAALVLAACTSVPTKEFAAYKTAFNGARGAGEHVLIDYAAAKVRHADQGQVLKAKAAALASPTAAPNSPSRRTALGARTPAAVDEVAIYMRAWEVIGQYNDFLTAIIEGKEAGEIETAYAGFKLVSSNLPAKLATEVGKALGPWQPLVDIAVDAAATEARNRRFVGKIKEGVPIVAAMLRVLQDDVENFSELEREINDIDRDELLKTVSLRRLRVKYLLGTYNYEDRAAVLSHIQDILVKVPGYTEDVPGSFDSGAALLPSDKVPTGTAIAAGEGGLAAPERITLSAAVKDIDDAAAALIALQTDLESRFSVLEAYRALLVSTDQSVRTLCNQAEKGEVQAPDEKVLTATVIEIRKLIELRDSKRRTK